MKSSPNTIDVNINAHESIGIINILDVYVLFHLMKEYPHFDWNDGFLITKEKRFPTHDN